MLPLRHVALIVCVLSPALLGAQVLYNTGAPPDELGNAWEMSGSNQAANFVLSSNSTITGAHIWTTFQDGNTALPNDGFQGNFDWTVFTDNGSGLPGIVVDSGQSVPTLTSQTIYQPGFDVSEWDIPLTPTDLSGGTRYWLSLHNTDAQGNYTDENFYWGASVNPPNTLASASQAGGTGPWTSNHATDADYFGYGNRLALALYGTVDTAPEPSSLVLFGTGLIGLMWKRRKTDRAKG